MRLNKVGSDILWVNTMMTKLYFIWSAEKSELSPKILRLVDGTVSSSMNIDSPSESASYLTQGENFQITFKTDRNSEWSDQPLSVLSSQANNKQCWIRNSGLPSIYSTIKSQKHRDIERLCINKCFVDKKKTGADWYIIRYWLSFVCEIQPEEPTEVEALTAVKSRIFFPLVPSTQFRISGCVFLVYSCVDFINTEEETISKTNNVAVKLSNNAVSKNK